MHVRTQVCAYALIHAVVCMCVLRWLCVWGKEGTWTWQIPTHNLNLIGAGLPGWGQNEEKISHINQDKIISWLISVLIMVASLLFFVLFKLLCVIVFSIWPASPPSKCPVSTHTSPLMAKIISAHLNIWNALYSSSSFFLFRTFTVCLSGTLFSAGMTHKES